MLVLFLTKSDLQFFDLNNSSPSLKTVAKFMFSYICRKYICYCGHCPRAKPAKRSQLFDTQSGRGRSLSGCFGDAPGGRLRGTFKNDLLRCLNISVTHP